MGTHGGDLFGGEGWEPPTKPNYSCEAERVGFEPTVAQRTTTVFETAPFSHCGTSPNFKIITERA
jgi:hypothetical protein